MKKLFKILGVTLLAVIVLIIAAPFFFKDQIAQIIKDKLNASMDAQIDYYKTDAFTPSGVFGVKVWICQK